MRNVKPPFLLDLGLPYWKESELEVNTVSDPLGCLALTPYPIKGQFCPGLSCLETNSAYLSLEGFPGSDSRESTCSGETWVRSLVRKTSW